MRNNRGLTLIEVLLALLIFTTTVLVCNKYYYPINRLVYTNITSQKMSMIAKNKMEELKSGCIYINDYKYNILDLDDQTINFTEKGYNINVLIKPLEDNENINYVNLKISNEEEDMFYNLIRYINFHENAFPNIYEEFVINND